MKSRACVCTTSAAVSVTRSRRPVSACPARYRRAANGAAAVPAAARHPCPSFAQLCQVYATSKLSSRSPCGSRGACQASPEAVTTAPSRDSPVIRSVPWCTGAGSAGTAAADAAAAVPAADAGVTAVSGTRASPAISAVSPAGRPGR